jgi:hypothetical protein
MRRLIEIRVRKGIYVARQLDQPLTTSPQRRKNCGNGDDEEKDNATGEQSLGPWLVKYRIPVGAKNHVATLSQGRSQIKFVLASLGFPQER